MVLGELGDVAVVHRPLDIEAELANQLRALAEKWPIAAHRAAVERDVVDVLGEVWPAVREFVLYGRPIPEEVLSLVARTADTLVAAGVPRRTLVKITRRYAAIAANQLVALGAEHGSDTAEVSGRAVVATHDVVSALLTDVLPGQGEPVVGTHSIDGLERSILVMIARGLSTVEIANALHYSRQAVSYHLGRLMTRFKVRNRTALVAFAYEQGLLDRRTGVEARP